MKRVLALLLCAVLLVTLAVSTIAVPATAEGIEATEEDTILIAFSDFQDKSGVASGKKTLQNLVATLENHGLKTADGVLFAGDLNASGSYTDPSSINQNKQSIKAIKEVFEPIVGENIIFAQGNHDLASTPGLSPNGNNDPATGEYGLYLIPEDQYGEWGNTSSETKKAAAELKAYLDAKAAANWKKPIFVVNHIPLHWGNRTLKDGSGSQGYQLVDVLNEGGAKGLNIIYLFGHNHSSGYDDFLGSSAIYLKKGDKMQVAHGTKYEVETETINFTYMNAGYVGYNSSNDPKADTALTLSVFLIRGNEVIITRYDANGVHNLKSKGTWHANFSEEGYHATPNTTVYASSRKVTATDDVEVEPPRYSPKEVPTTTTTTTTKATTTSTTQKPASTTQKPTSGSVFKPTVTQKTEPSTTASVVAPTTTGKPVDVITTAPVVDDPTVAPTDAPATTVPTDPIGTGTPSIEAPSATDAPTEPAATATATLAPPTATPEKDEDTSATPDKPFPVGVVVGVGVGVVAAAAVVILLLKKKSR
ncbi:MAG: hypothetical protein IKL13_07370 [Clostridia bacterium]|nr:hypothetical protein [Clostridia bacterium]